MELTNKNMLISCLFLLVQSFTFSYGNVEMTTRSLKSFSSSEEDVTDATASALMDDTSFFGCDFENGFCDWTNDTDAEFTWLRKKGETESKDTGPPWDHTIGRKRGIRGYYIYIEASSPRKHGDRARIISPPIGKPGTYCLKFWHHMHGSEIKDLNVYLKNIKTDQQQIIGHWSGPWSIETDIMPWVFGNSDWWNEEQIEFVANGNSQIVMEGVRGENYHGDIALDDIALTVGECPQRSINCTFDRNMCGWTQMSGDNFNWLPNRGPTNTQFTGPLSDHHEVDKPDGLYLYIEASWPRQDGDQARLQSPPVKCVPGAKPVFLFWYNMFGADVGPLRVYITNDPVIIDFPLWEQNTPQGQQWKLGQVPIPQNLIDNFVIIIEAERKEYRGDIAIDDVTLIGCDEPSIDYLTLKTSTAALVQNSPTTTTAAPKTTTSTMVVLAAQNEVNLNCSFEGSTLCGWKQDKSDNFDWTLHRKSTTSHYTGPKSAHNNSTGWYLYIEASSPRVMNNKAMLRSHAMDVGTSGCFSFFYHMYGKSMGKLELLLGETAGKRMTQLWTREGQQSVNDTDWKQAFVNVNATVASELVFRATRGVNLFSDIAIDDLSFVPKKCEHPSFTLTSSQKNDALGSDLAGSQQRGIQNMESLVKCSFDRKQLCKWTQVNTPFDDFNWQTGSKTPSTQTGPETDHSGHSGSFAYIEASTPRTHGDRATLKSERITISSPVCFKFWFHMYGDDIGSLSIYKQKGEFDEPELLWTRKGQQGNAWYEAHVNLPKSSGFNLLVEGMRGKGWRSDIAVDDFTMEDGLCPQFNCSFNDSFCGWRQRAMIDDFSWERHKGATPSLKTGPKSSRDGSYYAFIEASDPRKRKDIARLVSPTITFPEPSSCLTFWYHSYGEHIGRLSVFQKDANDRSDYLGSPLWYIDTSEGDQWLYARINVHSNKPYQIVIEGERGVDYGGDIAIDDVMLAPGKCNACCDDDTFLCGNNFCIPAEQRCDKKNDCGDESDESFCTACGISEVPPFLTKIKLQEVESTLLDDTNNLTRVRDAYSEEEAPTEEIKVNERELLFESKLIPESDIVERLTDEEVRKIVHPVLGTHHKWKNNENIVSEISYKQELIEVERKKRDVSEEMFAAVLEDPNTKKTIPPFNEKKTTFHYDDEEEFEEIEEFLQIQRLMKLPEQSERVKSFIKQQKLIQERKGDAHHIPHHEYTAMVPSKRERNDTLNNDANLLNRVRRSAILKITGGRKARWYSHPWQAAYYITASDGDTHYFCGGTLVDRYWVLTAAHCPQLGDLHEIVLGDYDLYGDEKEEQEMIVDAVYVHQKYNFSLDLVADIALIKLKYPAKSSRAVQTACMLGLKDEEFKENTPCFATGWGRIDAHIPGIQQVLREAAMPLVDIYTCQNKYWSIYEIYNSMVCAGGTGGNSCKGDSGGPLMCPKKVGKKYQYYVVGITSWGDTKCKPFVPGVYTRVQGYMRWISKIMHQDKCHRFPL